MRSEPAEEPATTVAHAAGATLDRAPRTLSLEVASPDARWERSGRIELAAGRFRLNANAPPGVISPRRPTVVGTSGEGYETTFAVVHGGFINPRSDRRCWFNPHLPVGWSHDTLSVEESVRLTGSIIESLRDEIETATMNDAEGYDVTLRTSAARPREDFDETKRRVWGDRELLTMLAGPIRVTIGDGGGIRSVALRLRDYRPEAQFGHPAPLAVSIRATLSPAGHRPLKLIRRAVKRWSSRGIAWAPRVERRLTRPETGKLDTRCRRRQAAARPPTPLPPAPRGSRAGA